MIQSLFTILHRSSSRCFSTSSDNNVSPSLHILLKSGFTPTLKSLNHFLLFLSWLRRYSTIVHLFSQMNSNKINVNSQTHSIFTWALLKSHKFEEAEDFMKTHMVKSSKRRIIRMWDFLIQGFCNKQEHPEKGLYLLRECLHDHGILPSSFSFCSLIHKFSCQGNMGKVIEVMELMADDRVKYPFDNFVSSSVITGFCKIGKPELALSFFENAVNSGAFQPNIVTYTALVSALCKLGRVEEVSNLVSKMEKEGLPFDVVFYSCWLCGYIEEEELMELLRKNRGMREKGIGHDTISYTILIDAFSKLGDVEKASGFLKKMKEEGMQPNSVTYTSIISGFCKKGKVEEAYAVFRSVENSEVEVDEFMYATLIDGFGRRGYFSHVFHLLDEMVKRGISPSIITYNTVIHGLCKFGRTSEADEFSKNIVADIITYSSLLHGYTKEKKVLGIIDIKRRLDEDGITMDLVMCNVLLKALFMVGAFEDIDAIYEKMPEMNLVADVITYCTLIDGYCKVGRIDEALEIFDLFRKTSICSDACYNSIINGLCKSSMVEMAIDVFIELNEKSLMSDLRICKILMNTIFKEKGAKGILNFICRMEASGLDVYSTICYDSIIFLCKRCSAVAASEIYIMMKRKGSLVTSKSYHSILRALIRVGKSMLYLPILNSFIKEFGLIDNRVRKILVYLLCLRNVDHALVLLDTIDEIYSSVTFPVSVVKLLIKDGRVLDAYKLIMGAKDKLPVMDVVDFSVIIDALCKGGYVLKALDLCTLARRKGITLNIVSYNSIINGLCLQGHLIEAFRLFDSLEKINLVPSEVTYATVIYALCREGLLQDAKYIFDKMIIVGFQPKAQIFNSLIDCMCKFGKVEEALKFLADSEMISIKIDSFTVSAIINGFCYKGDMEKALQLFAEFKRKSTLPDFLGFLYLIRGLCSKGRMEEAQSVLREMLQCNPVVDLINAVNNEVVNESIQDLLLSLCVQGSIQEATTVLNEIASVIFPVRRWSNPRLGMIKHQRLSEFEGNSNLESPNAGHLTAIENEVSHLERSGLNDFDSYYSIIATHCSGGNSQKAIGLVREMLSNLNSG